MGFQIDYKLWSINVSGTYFRELYAHIVLGIHGGILILATEEHGYHNHLICCMNFPSVI
jgi:hypothetical protein